MGIYYSKKSEKPAFLFVEIHSNDGRFYDGTLKHRPGGIIKVAV